MTIRENDIAFDFSNAHLTKLDDKGKRQPHGFQLVDFVIEEKNRLLMIEVKDPSCRPRTNDEKALKAISAERDKFITKLNNDALINEELTPKARDSYCFLHLMDQDKKPITYVVLLGIDNLPIDDASLLSFKERLLFRLCQETDLPWVLRYIKDCLILTEKTWSEAFPNYPINRVY
jgi:hypothetical protein